PSRDEVAAAHVGQARFRTLQLRQAALERQTGARTALQARRETTNAAFGTRESGQAFAVDPARALGSEGGDPIRQVNLAEAPDAARDPSGILPPGPAHPRRLRRSSRHRRTWPASRPPPA